MRLCQFNFELVTLFFLDPQTKIWNFPLSEHDKLLSAVQCLKPAVQVGGLPQYVFRVRFYFFKCVEKFNFLHILCFTLGFQKSTYNSFKIKSR